MPTVDSKLLLESLQNLMVSIGRGSHPDRESPEFPTLRSQVLERADLKSHLPGFVTMISNGGDRKSVV